MDVNLLSTSIRLDAANPLLAANAASSGYFIYTWPDSSDGTSDGAFQTNVALAPLLVPWEAGNLPYANATFGGTLDLPVNGTKNVLRFFRSAYLNVTTTKTPAVNSTFSQWFVFRPKTSTTQVGLWQNGATCPTGACEAISIFPNGTLGYTDSANATSQVGNVNLNKWNVLAMRTRVVTGDVMIDFFLNGIHTFSMSQSRRQITVGRACLGRARSFASFEGDVAEFLVSKENATNATMSTTFAALQQKWFQSGCDNATAYCSNNANIILSSSNPTIASSQSSTLGVFNPLLGSRLIAVNCGGTNSGAYIADGNFTGGQTNTVSLTLVQDTWNSLKQAPNTIYQSQRIGSDFSYLLTGIGANRRGHTIRIHMADNRATASLMTILIQGKVVVRDFTAFSYGSAVPFVLDFTNIAADVNGQITVRFQSKIPSTTATPYALVNALEVYHDGLTTTKTTLAANQAFPLYPNATLWLDPASLSTTQGNYLLQTWPSLHLPTSWNALGASSRNQRPMVNPFESGSSPYQFAAFGGGGAWSNTERLWKDKSPVVRFRSFAQMNMPAGTIPISSSAYTISVAFRITTLANFQVIMWAGADSALDSQILFVDGNTGAIVDSWRNAYNVLTGAVSVNHELRTPQNTVIPNQWVVATWLYNGTHRHIYVNGQLQAMAAKTGRTVTAAQQTLGGGLAFDQYNGDIGEVVVSKIGVSAAQREAVEKALMDRWMPKACTINARWINITQPRTTEYWYNYLSMGEAMIFPNQSSTRWDQVGAVTAWQSSLYWTWLTSNPVSNVVDDDIDTRSSTANQKDPKLSFDLGTDRPVHALRLYRTDVNTRFLKNAIVTMYSSDKIPQYSAPLKDAKYFVMYPGCSTTGMGATGAAVVDGNLGDSPLGQRMISIAFFPSIGWPVGSFESDLPYLSGTTSNNNGGIYKNVAGTRAGPDYIYQYFRSGVTFDYSIPNLAPSADGHTVRFHWADFVATTVAERLFNVTVNGQDVLTHFSIRAHASPASGGAIVMDIAGITTNATGFINIKFTKATGSTLNAIVGGVEVFYNRPVGAPFLCGGASFDSTIETSNGTSKYPLWTFTFEPHLATMPTAADFRIITNGTARATIFAIEGSRDILTVTLQATGSGSIYPQPNSSVILSVAQGIVCNRTSAGVPAYSRTSLSAGGRSALVGGELFLGGNFIELGITSLGNFGTRGAIPDGFYGTKFAGLGMSNDADGFGIGSDLRIDFFLPGSPEERWTLGANNVSVGSYCKLSGSYGPPLSKATVLDLSDPEDGLLAARTSGIIDTGFVKLKVEQTHMFLAGDTAWRTEVVLTNLGGSTAQNIQFMRSFDPDNTVFFDGGAGYTTNNTVVGQYSVSNYSMVIAVSMTSGYKAAAGLASSVFYWSEDERSRVYTGGFANTNPYVWNYQNPGYNLVSDSAIGIIGELGSIEPGEKSEAFVYYTALTLGFDTVSFLGTMTSNSAKAAAMPMVKDPPADTISYVALVADFEDIASTTTTVSTTSTTQSPTTSTTSTASWSPLPEKTFGCGAGFVCNNTGRIDGCVITVLDTLTNVTMRIDGADNPCNLTTGAGIFTVGPKLIASPPAPWEISLGTGTKMDFQTINITNLEVSAVDLIIVSSKGVFTLTIAAGSNQMVDLTGNSSFHDIDSVTIGSERGNSVALSISNPKVQAVRAADPAKAAAPTASLAPPAPTGTDGTAVQTQGCSWELSRWSPAQLADSWWSGCMTSTTCKISRKFPNFMYGTPWYSMGKFYIPPGGFGGFVASGNPSFPFSFRMYNADGSWNSTPTAAGKITHLGADFLFWVGSDSNTGTLMSMTSGMKDESGFTSVGILNPTILQIQTRVYSCYELKAGDSLSVPSTTTSSYSRSSMPTTSSTTSTTRRPFGSASDTNVPSPPTSFNCSGSTTCNSGPNATVGFVDSSTGYSLDIEGDRHLLIDGSGVIKPANVSDPPTSYTFDLTKTTSNSTNATNFSLQSLNLTNLEDGPIKVQVGGVLVILNPGETLELNTTDESWENINTLSITGFPNGDPIALAIEAVFVIPGALAVCIRIAKVALLIV